jgi:hypothetical protein
MAEDLKEFKKEIGVKWVKAESGTSYLCPVKALQRLGAPNEADLKKVCVDESDNPQND